MNISLPGKVWAVGGGGGGRLDNDNVSDGQLTHSPICHPPPPLAKYTAKWFSMERKEFTKNFLLTLLPLPTSYLYPNLPIPLSSHEIIPDNDFDSR